MNRNWKIVLADDHAIVRSALCKLIASSGDLEVVAECDSADEAVGHVIRQRPDMLLLDIDMPGVTPFDAARTVKSQDPTIRLIFLSAHSHDRYIERALAIEASGYVTKTEPPERVLEALRRVASGRTYFSPEVRSRIVLDDAGARLARPTRTRMATLSPREIEVLQYIASGRSKKEIATLMHLSVKTVDNHSTNLMSKLDIHDRVELTKYAIREGLATA